MSKADLSIRINAVIDELVPVGTTDAAALATILLAAQAALRRGDLLAMAVTAWVFACPHPDPGGGEAVASLPQG